MEKSCLIICKELKPSAYLKKKKSADVMENAGRSGLK
jgi:hypothetical protein